MIAILDITSDVRFFAQAGTVGAVDEEIEAMDRGDLPQERADIIRANMRAAAFHLGACMVFGERC